LNSLFELQIQINNSNTAKMADEVHSERLGGTAPVERNVNTTLKCKLLTISIFRILLPFHLSGEQVDLLALEAEVEVDLEVEIKLGEAEIEAEVEVDLVVEEEGKHLI
jgi:hypothetical protein